MKSTKSGTSSPQAKRETTLPSNFFIHSTQTNPPSISQTPDNRHNIQSFNLLAVTAPCFPCFLALPCLLLGWPLLRERRTLWSHSSAPLRHRRLPRCPPPTHRSSGSVGRRPWPRRCCRPVRRRFTSSSFETGTSPAANLRLLQFQFQFLRGSC